MDSTTMDSGRQQQTAYKALGIRQTNICQEILQRQRGPDDLSRFLPALLCYYRREFCEDAALCSYVFWSKMKVFYQLGLD